QGQGIPLQEDRARAVRRELVQGRRTRGPDMGSRLRGWACPLNGRDTRNELAVSSAATVHRIGRKLGVGTSFACIRLPFRWKRNKVCTNERPNFKSQADDHQLLHVLR